VNPSEALEKVVRGWENKLQNREAILKSEKKDLIKVAKRAQKKMAGLWWLEDEQVVVRPRVWNGKSLKFKYNLKQKALEVTMFYYDVPPGVLSCYNTPIPLKWYIKYQCNSLTDLETVGMAVSTLLSFDPRLN